MKSKRNDIVYMTNINDSLKKKLSKKKVAIVLVATLIVIIIIVLFSTYAMNESFRNRIDEYMIFKHIEENNVPYINIENLNNATIFAWSNCIAVIDGNKITKYDSVGKDIAEINVELTNPITATNGEYAVVSEKNGKKIYLLKRNEILWEKDLEGRISKINVNAHGYVSVIVTGTTYRSVIEIYNDEGAELFKKLNLDKNIFCDVSFKYSYNKIEIPEECYLYDYIAENNVFKKYENNLINLFKIIFTSDLFRDLIKLLYKAEDENMKYFFEDEMTVEEFWNNKILFVPFKIKRVSDFSYKDTFNILFSFYKFQYFESNIENEIFTLGAFVRVLIHEIFGHIMLAYFYFMFYANFENNKDNFYSPRNKEKIKNLNKSFLYEKIGVSLANSFLNNLLEVKEENALSEKLCNNFEIILGKEYAKRLTQKLLEDKLNIIKIKNEKNLADLSVKIVDILMEFISKDFDNYIKDLDINQNKYKEEESGNLVEFLLFNNFNQYITLKECLFLLDEEVYKKTNIFKFRFKFNNVFKKNNDEFIKELVEGKKIFNDIFYEYNSIYLENKNNNNNDLISPKSFRENFEENLNKKIEPFQCFNLSLDRRILLDKKKSSSKY